jgi:TonB family protein
MRGDTDSVIEIASWVVRSGAARQSGARRDAQTVTSSFLVLARPAALFASIVVHAATFGVLVARTSNGEGHAPATAPAPLYEVSSVLEATPETIPPPPPVTDPTPPITNTSSPIRNTPAPTRPSSADAPTTARAGIADSPPDMGVAAAVEAPADAPVRFTLPSSAAFKTQGTPLGEATTQTATAPAAVETTISVASASARAKLLSGGKAVYPMEARAAEIECDIPVDLLIDANGVVVSASTTSHVGYGLEAAAVRALQTARFSPFVEDGRAVRVRTRWVMSFRLR